MAEVWKAFDTQLQRFVAIKLLHANLQADPDFITRFTREAQMVAVLRHPNIVQIYDFHISERSEAGASEADTLAYMVMEYIQGRTLADYIINTSRKKQFPPPVEIIRLFTPISLALDYAHAQGMIHRDIKPANILLDQRHTARNAMGEPILSDFGLAKVLGAVAQTITGSLLGTPLYISPEQVQNRPVSEQTDIYSLAVVLYEVCAGVPPFRGESVTGVMMQHLTATPPEPHLVNPNLPPALSKILLKGLAKNPVQRYHGAAAMTAAVAEALNIPVPEDLKQAVSAMEDVHSLAAQTVLSSSSAGIAPSSSAEATISSPSSPDVFLSVPPNAEAVASGDDLSSTPRPVRAEAISGPVRLPDSDAWLGAHVERAADPARESAQTPAGKVSPPVVSSKTLPLVVSQPLQPLFQKRPGLIALVALLIVVLIGSGLGTFFLLTHHSASTPSPIVSNSVVGQAFFVSSGKLNLISNQGNNDQFQINLHNIPDPHSGTSYYAWLLPDKSQVEAAPILLGKVAVNHGVVHFFYGGDNNHSNLLATTSRFLITEESASIMPNVPTPDLTAWRYYSELPQTPAQGQTYSLLETLHLQGGLAIWTYSNTQKIQGWAGSARDDWKAKDFASLRKNIVKILDYVDGEKLVGQDVPAGTPILADPQIAQVGLLQLKANQQPPGYFYHIPLHLNGVLSSPGATQYQRTLAAEINSGVNNVNSWLGQLRQDAVQLVDMGDAHLALQSSLTLLNDVMTQANNAYMGRKDPSTGQQQIGVSQIYRNVQLLATFDVRSKE